MSGVDKVVGGALAPSSIGFRSVCQRRRRCEPEEQGGNRARRH